MPAELILPCMSRQRREVAQLRISPAADTSAVASAQLHENGHYWCELLEPTPTDWHIECSLIRAQAPNPKLVLIETGAHVGLLRLDVADAGGRVIGTTYAEVRSLKLHEPEQHRAMLNDIGAQLMALLFDARSSLQMRLQPAWRNEPRWLQQQVEFLRNTLESPAFGAAVQRVLLAPHQHLTPEHITRPAGFPIKHSRSIARQMAGDGARVPLRASHPLAQRLAEAHTMPITLPARLTMTRAADTLDTPENRFVKFALASFADFLQRATTALRTHGAEWDVVARRAETNARELEHMLTHSFFQALSPLQALPLSSPVLQRKDGYRDLLQIWLRFEANTRVAWDGSDDVFHAGQRDTARLYEYWLFFHVLQWFCSRFDPARKSIRSLVQVDGDRVTLTLRHGQTAGPFEGEFGFGHGARPVKAQFSYNRAFSPTAQAAHAGSWTRRMQPDFTLTFWPAKLDLAQAEANGTAVHLHLDAKYRVEHMRDALAIDTPQDANANRDDLLKMHAYRDAIRRSGGAYVLYPGRDAPQIMYQGVGVVPSLGAFGILPSRNGQPEGMSALAAFLERVVGEVG